MITYLNKYGYYKDGKRIYIVEWVEDGEKVVKQFDNFADCKYEYDIIKECVEDVE